jgi:radical SAM/Cys-rich protein
MYAPDLSPTKDFIERERESFSATLANHNLYLTRDETTTLQVNVGLLCNQTCHHCHLDAGPFRHEIMDEKTISHVIDLAKNNKFNCIDITGGAPEMNPHIASLLLQLSPLTERLMLRSNLTAIATNTQDDLLSICKENKVTLVASFPSLSEAQAKAQRGPGVFQKSISTLKKLNSLGYGIAGSELELNLVSNPAGSFLPSDQKQAEKRFRQVLQSRWDITFNNLFTFANMPLGRFYEWLVRSGNYEKYLEKLVSNFNPCSMDGLMCRSLLSVSWDGYLFDCDFNQAADLYMNSQKTHISELNKLPEPGQPIAVANHCYTCTAGAGFT